MISAKNIYNSHAYRQLKAYANGDKALLKRLVEEYVENYNNYEFNKNKVKFSNSMDILGSFTWDRTPQGQGYWSYISDGY